MKASTTFAVAGIIMLISVGSMFVPSTPVQAGLWDMVTTSDWETKELDAFYLLSVEGYDARAYEFTPEANPQMTCVFVTSNKSSGVACFPKHSYIVPFKILTQ